MNTTIDYSRVPFNYAICLNRECEKASTCLRQLIEPIIPAKVEHWTIISPRFLASLGGPCPYYRSSTKVRFAKGFIGILNNLPYTQMQKVICTLMRHFNRRTYYRIRKGERLLSPQEQKMIFNIIKGCGVSHPQDFDAYVEDFDW